MATPTMVTITGQLQTPPGTPDGTAKVRLEQQVWLTHSDGTVIEPTVYEDDADASGNVTLTVPASTDPAWLPQSWAYRVTFDGIENPQWAKPFRVVIPHTDQSITLGDLVPVGQASDGVLYAPANHTHSGYLPTTGGTVSGSLDVTGTLDATSVGGDLSLALDAAQRRVANAELVIPRRNANGFAALDSDVLYVTHFTASQTRTITSVRTTCGVAGTGISHAWLGFLRWQAGIGYTPVSLSVDDPSRWSSATTYDTQVFGVDGFGSANLADPGFDMVAGLEYAFTVQGVWSGTKPQLRACSVNAADAFEEPRQNGYMGLSAPPSSLLQPGWLVGSHAQFQGLMKY